MSLFTNDEKSKTRPVWRPMEEAPKDASDILVTYLCGKRRMYAQVSSRNPYELIDGFEIRPEAWQPIFMSQSELIELCKACLGKGGASVQNQDGTFSWTHCGPCHGSGKRSGWIRL